MLPLALLPLELLLVGLVVAESSAECEYEGLGDKLNNNLGQTPCTVKPQILQACRDHDNSLIQNCTCNTIYYNVCAACTACQGGVPQTWSDWARMNTCKPDPVPFPTQIKLSGNTLPDWAHQSLTSSNDFNLAAALQSSPQSGPSKAEQIAVPIAVGAGVAVLAGLLFWWYRRRRWRRQRSARIQPLSESLLSYPRRWVDEVWVKTHSTRLKPSPKDSNWEIDDDEWLQRHSAFYDPYSPPKDRDRQMMHEMGVRPTHNREASSSTLLPHIEFPTVHRVPTFLERFIKFKDGLRKSATYKAKYVSAISPDHTFRIDGSAADSPITRKFEESPPDGAGGHSRSGSSGSQPQPQSQSQQSSSSFQPHRVSTVREEDEEKDTPGGAPVLVDRADFEPPRYPAEFPSEVLVISRDGQDFALDDASTVAPATLRTPISARQPSSVYSSPPLSSVGHGHSDSSSSYQGPRRANTSSTASGAYPRELRRDEDEEFDATGSRSARWRLPAPPQSVAPSSARAPLPGW